MSDSQAVDAIRAETDPSDDHREQAPAATPSRHGRWQLGVIVLIYLTVYARTTTFGYVWDDPVNSASSALLRGPLSTVIRKGEHARSDPAVERMPKDIVPRHESYRPVSVTSHWLDVHLLHDRPGLFHLHNVLLGLVSLLLVWRLGSALGTGPWLAGLWALHPLHVEVFAYISARSDLLAAIFAMLAMLASLRSAATSRTAVRWTWAGAAAVAYLLSLFCKEANVTLPAAILVLAWARGQARATVASVATMVVGTVVYFPLRKAVMLATSLPMAQGKALARVLVDLPGVALAYAATFLSPFSPPDRQFWEGYVPLGFAAIALLAGVFILVRRRLPAERKAGLAVPFAALLGYVVLLLPAALGFRSIGALAGRYVFFPFLYLAMACLFLARFCQPEVMHFSALLRRVPLTLWAGLLIAATAMQISAWHDDESLARYSLTMYPDNGAALYRMATVLTDRGDFRAALPLLERCVARNPDQAKVLNNLAVTYLNLERIDDAKETLRRALPLSGATDRKFWYNVASVQLAAGKIPKACGALVRALEIDPGYSAALAMQQQICPR